MTSRNMILSQAEMSINFLPYFLHLLYLSLSSLTIKNEMWIFPSLKMACRQPHVIITDQVKQVPWMQIQPPD